jgi:FkbM family methyltransferase
MLNYIRKKINNHFLKRTFKEYGYELVNLKLEKEGDVQFAKWQHPFNGMRDINQGHVDFFKRYVKKGSLAIDIGANYGDTTVPLALAVGAEGMVLAFEPNPHVFKTLEANAKLNPTKTRIIPLRHATTVEEKEYTFGSGDASFGNGGIVGFTSNIRKNVRYTFQVQGINLEKFLFENYATWLNNISLIKLDTEGYDKEILKTIPKILSGSRPVIVAECFRQLNNSERQELYDVIHNHGYEIFHHNIFDPGEPIPISRNDMMKWKHFDILALPKKK